MKLDFSEISDWMEFENLVVAFFEGAKENGDNNVFIVETKPTGIGADGGRDIFVTFGLNDSIINFQRKWVVQCKFHKKAISKSNLADINIPSLIHEYNADGYLLVCKSVVSSELTRSFENLERNCKFGYKYVIWNGNDFGLKLVDKKNILKNYFPQYSKINEII